MAQTDRILKVDTAGRVWTPREQREAVLDEFERSGQPASKFAAHIGVKYPTFASWVQKRRKRRGDGAAPSRKEPAALQWVEATVDDAKAGAARTLIVHLPGGARLEVSDAAQAVLAAQLLRAFGGGGLAC
jgi:transposase-like protein